MATEEIRRIGVVGCGLMGSGISEVCARAGRSVVVVEADGASLDRGRRRVESSIARALASHKLIEDAPGETLGRIDFTTDLGALCDRQLVVEAVVEAAADKVRVFEVLDKVVEAPDALLTSNTSSIPIMKLAMATGRPAQVVGLHFFNPVPVLPLVEVVASLLSGDDAVARAERFAVEVLGKHAIRSKD
ncbi:MAG: 3-hydroxyacyl-CoA dehydrogenase NAD-binding domain-containing protein, partial [Acidimicrobiales bacterium]